MSRPVFLHADGVAISPALIVVLLTALFYLKLDLRFGLAMAAFLAFCLWLGQWVAAQSMTLWLVTGIGLFVVGWVFQFVGHYYEGRKPAFVDDLMGLAIGPIFVAAELAFELGLRKDVQDAVEARVGPTHVRAMKPAQEGAVGSKNLVLEAADRKWVSSAGSMNAEMWWSNHQVRRGSGE